LQTFLKIAAYARSWTSLWAKAPTPADARRLTEKKVARVLAAHRIRRITAADAFAILQRPALTVAPGTIEAARAHITATAERLNSFNRQIKDVTRRLAALVEQLAGPEHEPGQGAEQRDAAILRSLPRVGRIVLATLLAEAHQAIQGRDYCALRTLTGVASVTKRSGKSCRVEMRQAAPTGCEQPSSIGQKWPHSTMPEQKLFSPRCAPEVIRMGEC
jgi:septal ring factor EnvC (AmiA/AmiB activator)